MNPDELSTPFLKDENDKPQLVPTADVEEAGGSVKKHKDVVVVAEKLEMDRNQTTAAPEGSWSHAMCSTCTCVAAIFCWSCFLANVMSRIGLNVCAHPSPTCGGSWWVFVVVVGLFLVFAALGVVEQGQMAEMKDTEDNVGGDVSFLAVYAIRCVLAVVFVVLIVKTRAEVRRRYNMRPTPGEGCEDSVLACFCTSCVVAQMQDQVQTSPPASAD